MRPAFFLLMAAFFAAGLSLPAAAQAPGVQPLDRILPEISRTHPGRFYDADGPTPGPDGSPHYHLKWMTPDGRIEWLDTDARTGRVLSISPGRDNFDGPGPGAYYAPAPSRLVPPGFFGEGFRSNEEGYNRLIDRPLPNYPRGGGQGYGGGRNRGDDRGDRDRRGR